MCTKFCVVFVYFDVVALVQNSEKEASEESEESELGKLNSSLFLILIWCMYVFSYANACPTITGHDIVTTVLMINM